ncbi:MAG: hypothetical protein WCU00_03335, partial [Candidatus Latescibacterota bacterium]
MNTRSIYTLRIMLLALVFSLATAASARAATRTSTATGGVWATAGTWVGGVAPASTDLVVIATTGTDSVTVGATATCAGLTVNSGGKLCFNTGTIGMTVNGDVTNYGTITVSNTTNTNTRTLTVTGNFTCDGVFDGRSAVDDVLNLIFSGTSTQTISGFTVSTLPGNNGTIAQTIQMTKTGGVATFTGNVNGVGLTINGTGGTLNLGVGLTHTFSGAWTRTAGTLNGGSSIVNFSLAGVVASGTGGTFTAGTGTVNYNSAIAQTIAGVTYNNLTLSGGGSKTTTGVTVNGILSMEGTATASAAITYGAAATLQYNTTTPRTAATNEWKTPFAATGGVIIAGAGTITANAAKVFNASVPLTINSGSSLAMSTYLLTLNDDLINNGGTTSGSGGVTIAGAATQSIGAFTTTGTVSMTKTGGTATFTGNVNGGALTLNGNGGTLNLGVGLTHTFTGTFTIKKGTLNGGSSTLNLGGSVSGTGATFTAGTGTVNYNKAAAQTIAGVTYNNLTLSGGGAKTTTGATVSGILSMEGTATTTGTAPTYGAAATLQYKGSAAQTTGAEFRTPWTGTGGVIINNANGVMINADKTINSTLTLISGKVTTGSNTIIIGSGGSVSGGSSSSYVVGNLRKYVATGATTRTFEVGTASSYDPVTVTFGNVTGAGTLTAKATSGEQNNIGSSMIIQSKNVNVFWTLTNGGIAFTNYNATFVFNSSDVDAGADISHFVAGEYSGGWTYPTVGVKTLTSTQITGVTSFGDFVVGEINVAVFDTSTKMATDINGGQAVPADTLLYTITLKNTG